MKKSMLVAGLLQFVVALALTAPASAQPNTYTIHVPFSFNVEGRTLPAGNYRVVAAAPALAEILGIDRSNFNLSAGFATFRQYRPAGEPQIGELVFHRYNQQYFLAEAWFGGSPSGYMLPTTHAEKEYAKQAPKTDTVLFAAK
jgi:hypothetical protein